MELLNTLVQISSPEDKWEQRLGNKAHTDGALHQDLWYMELNLVSWQTPREIWSRKFIDILMVTTGPQVTCLRRE
jgi:hypothetical protein